MGTLEKKKIFFEEADRPPPSYYDGSLEKMPLKKVPFQTPDPETIQLNSALIFECQPIALDNCAMRRA
ncbi:hypothetical protein ANCCEY_10604 [Ancylostoma ceylanicum]|uniref:Uncharacterized protein n=1 Tax=Ancylostoma ceylanicum TaxID=53326 RepID=A0A0D6LRQ9_9BILA|nr:hypothetical protein ANCCEY_10604 [Ancylostoma ceylanicum]